MKFILKKSVSILLCVMVLLSYLIMSGTKKYDTYLLMAEKCAERIFLDNENFTKGAVFANYINGVSEEKQFILVTGKQQGYAIFNKEDLQIIEYSPYGVSPYSNYDLEKVSYGGVGNYLHKNNGKTKNILSNKTYNAEEMGVLKDNINKKLFKNKNIKNSKYNVEKVGDLGNINELEFADSYSIKSKKYIQDYKYFLNDIYYHKNEDKTCSTVATQILLGYTNWSKEGRLINNSNYKYNYTANSSNYNIPYHKERTSTSDALYNYLVNIIDIEKDGASMYDIQRGVINYLNANVESDVRDNFNYGVIINTSNANSRVKQNIDNGFPSIASITYLSENEQIFHAVVVYGYQTISMNGVNVDGYVAHFGWDRDSSFVWFNKNWLQGCFYLTVEHQHNYLATVEDGHILECSICGCIKATNQHTRVRFDRIIDKITFEATKFDATKQHVAYCSCGDIVINKHTWIYTDTMNKGHNKYCWQCNYFDRSIEPHFYKNNGICYYCLHEE